MPRVICTLHNASAEISGVKFHPLDDGGLVSDEITGEQAAVFLSIPGYESWDQPDVVVTPVAPPPPRTRKPAAAPKKAEAVQPAVTVETPTTPPVQEAEKPADEGAVDEGGGEVF